MIRMGVVADDITGSNDIGIMFAKAGYRTRVYNFEQAGDFSAQYQPVTEPEIIILNTNSRLDASDVAYKKVYAASRELHSMGCQQFHNKTCSVFRGNIGAEFDAMLDALQEDFAVVVLGFPKNGRTTINGLHYVRGTLLQESEFQHDPVHPMTRSNLVEILQTQTQRTVGLIAQDVVAQGTEVIRQALAQARGQFNYVILDVTDQQALATIAEAVGDAAVLCGSSAIAEELPAVWRDTLPPAAVNRLPYDAGLGLLIAAGSLMPQTRAQIEHMQAQGAPVVMLDTAQLFTRDTDALLAAYTAAIVSQMHAGQDVVFHSANSPQAVQHTLEQASAAGYTRQEAARIVSQALARVVQQVLEQTAQNRLIVAGGETSDAVCKQLGINSLQIHREIQAGLPSCFSQTDPVRLLVLKSGSFGSPDFFAQAITHLRSN